MPQQLTVLLVDRSASLFQLLDAELSDRHTQVIHNSDSNTARLTLEQTDIGVAILDFSSLVNRDITFVTELRNKGNQSFILMLSDTGTPQECVECLSAGADDYLPSPFAHDELTARIRSLMRYAMQRNPDISMIDYQGLRLNTDESIATFDNITLTLTPAEYRVLAAIYRNTGDTLSHEALIEELHGYKISLTRNSIEVHISAIRRKLKEAGAPTTIHTRRGYGYYIL